jgi:CheY-like chemotaxis protein
MSDAPSNLRTELLVDVSHELRTPLNAVLGMLELSLDEALSSVLRDYLSTAYQSAQRLVVVLDDMADLLQARRGELDLVAAPFELRNTIDLALAPFAAEAEARNLALVVRVQADVPDHLQGDAMRLKRILASMTEYVVSAGGASTVNVSAAVVSRAPQAVKLALGVTDEVSTPDLPADAAAAEGDPDLVEHCEDRLALATARQLIERMNGRLWIDPDHPTRLCCTVRLALAGKGSLPRKSSASRKRRRAAIAPPRPVGLTNCPLNVLVVDDTLANQKVVKTILTKRGHHVEVVDNGRRALECVRERSFDVVLMDAQMPVMNGLEATESIRELDDAAQAHVPIIAMTAHVMHDARQRCLAAGMDDYLAKPLSAAALVACVEFNGRSTDVASPQAALARLGGDEELLHELMRMFHVDAPALLDKLRAASQQHDTQAVVRAAHSLRGLAANFDAAPTVDAATAVERLAGEGDHRVLEPALQTLESELAVLCHALDTHLRRHS